MPMKLKSNQHLLSRWILYKGEVCRLPQQNLSLKVLSGYAWITTAGQDIMLVEGQETLIFAKETVLVSALRNSPLIFEVLGNEKDVSGGVQLPANAFRSKQLTAQNL